MAGALPVFLDIEASGFGAGSYLIEVGCVMPDGQAICCLVRPLDEWQHRDAAAEAIHHITRDVLLQHGLPVDDVVDRLEDALRGREVFSDARGNDYAWLSRLPAGCRASACAGCGNCSMKNRPRAGIP
jgi:hypothetical protein